jgi:hypothetical protein
MAETGRDIADESEVRAELCARLPVLGAADTESAAATA